MLRELPQPSHSPLDPAVLLSSAGGWTSGGEPCGLPQPLAQPHLQVISLERWQVAGVSPPCFHISLRPPFPKQALSAPPVTYLHLRQPEPTRDPR